MYGTVYNTLYEAVVRSEELFAFKASFNIDSYSVGARFETQIIFEKEDEVDEVIISPTISSIKFDEKSMLTIYFSEELEVVDNM